MQTAERRRGRAKKGGKAKKVLFSFLSLLLPHRERERNKFEFAFPNNPTALAFMAQVLVLRGDSQRDLREKKSFSRSTLYVNSSLETKEEKKASWLTKHETCVLIVKK